MPRTKEAGIAYNAIGWRNHIRETYDGYSYADRPLVRPGESVKVVVDMYTDTPWQDKHLEQTRQKQIDMLYDKPIFRQ